MLTPAQGRINMAKNIMTVRSNDLCVGCGTCSGICPTSAITMIIQDGIYLPEVNEEKCNHCQLCIKSCPGYSVDFEKLNMKIFNKQPENSLLGNYLSCYVGHSTDAEIRSNSTSGGIASQLLIFALEAGIIDGALVIRMKRDQPLESEGFIARTKEDILNSSKSKYCSVSPNEALNQILQEEGKYAVVGLPCHIHGLRKAEEVNKQLKKRIVLHLGLMCSHSVNYMGTEFILKKLGIAKEDVQELGYRCKGWPGGMEVTLKNGSVSHIPLFGTWNSYWAVFSSYFFTPIRCLMCPDQTAELADISLGDAWLPEIKNDELGESMVVCRTKIGEKIFSSAHQSKTISAVSVDCMKAIQSQKLLLNFKKNFFATRCSLLKSVGKQMPIFNDQKTSRQSPVSFFKAFYPYFNATISSKKSVVSILQYVPFPVFRLYFGIYKFISKI